METKLLDLVLKPHRSLPPRGFFWVMALLCAASFAAGAVFASMGAWPVLPFLGLDVLLVWAAFKASYAGARAREHIALYSDRLEIVSVDSWGRKQRRTLEPYWLNVEAGEQVALRSHGRRTVVGAFLDQQARADLARTLAEALAAWRQSPDMRSSGVQSPSTSRIE
jgi:uncharacterized membrane protein